MRKRRTGHFVCILALVLSMVLSVSEADMSCYAQTDNKTLGMNFRVVKGGVQTSISKINKGVNIHIDKPDDTSGYVFIYQYSPQNWSEYEALVVDMENPNDFSVNINLNIEDSNGNRFSLADGSPVLLEGMTDKKLHAKEVLGTLEIPAGFKGSVYAVFGNFECDENLPETAVSKFKNITTWGITLIPPKDRSEGDILIRSAELLTHESAARYEHYSKMRIAGDDEMQLPVYGQTIASYEVLNKETKDKIVFELPQAYKGISVSDDGVVMLTTDALSSEIRLDVKVNEELIIEKEIGLVKSWATGKKSADGVLFALQNPDSRSHEKNTNFVNRVNGSIFYVRTIFLGISIGLILVLRYWKKRKS